MKGRLWSRGKYLLAGCVMIASPLAAADQEAEPRGMSEKTNTAPHFPARRWLQNDRRMETEPAAGEQRLIDRLLANDKLTAEIGLSDAAAAKLREGSNALQARHAEFNEQIKRLSLDQVEHMSRLLFAADANTNEVMKTAEEIGRLRTEQAKLAIQRLLLLRQYLTPEQIRKAREVMHERQTRKDGEPRTPPAKKDKLSKNTPTAKPPEGW